MKKFYVFFALLAAVTLAACGTNTVAVQEESSHPEWSYNAVMYELNTRQFTPEGTFAAAERHLPRLKQLGVDIIWFMPLHPIGVEGRKGELGSYYSISDYKAVNPEFGTMDDFKRFVSEAHAQGFKVIMDWVPNHTSHDALWINNEGWYEYDEDGNPYYPFDWSDIAQLDFNNHNTRAAMLDAMKFWIREADIDGYRCDYAVGPPMDFWTNVIEELKDVKSDIFMLAKAEEVELHTEGGFDADYAWEAHHIMNALAKEEYPIDSLRNYLVRDARRYPADAIRLQMTSNHDENSWNGTEFERLGDAAKTFAILSYVIPGMPLIYNGQEVGFDRRLEFFVKDEIDWTDRGGFGELYTRLNALKHRSGALAAGEKGGIPVEIDTDNPFQVFAMSRESGGNKVISVFNLSSRTAAVNVNFGEHSGNYKDALTGDTVAVEPEQMYTMEPWQYIVLEN
ncbi:MAG: alpha-amylase [Alistipes sp.]|nr:alpha-amylase [Alistipes sp.]